jgi:prepilin-type N-terminal cleavage/methylation domain-containing protein
VKGKARQQAVGSRLSVVGRPLPAALLPAADYRLPTTGFTLVEVLVALALISTIVMMVYGSFLAASRSLDLYGSRMACDDRASLVLRLMARQLRCAYLPPVETDPLSSSSPNGVPSTPRTSLPAEPLTASEAGLSFITTAGLGTGPALSRILYRHDPATGILSLCGEPYLYGAEAQASARSWRPILTGVRSVEVQFYDGQQWQSGWTGASQTLPQSAKIALAVVDEKNRLHEFETMVPLGCRRALPQPSVTTGAGKL